ncbi:uncharacterized protein LOC120282798 [Dioscorea cayenensis subsp. rotundata]|uniref:Uncharacterized protein LOC120282798 n=1 Tax=Dioscorea cayennensis subsp. rotundata TaxID=55577 RepID=A0AB40D5P7_DIOCR|nr:uncharacterized protein LOC120282798 [Dioscorea cayenensis subsp. rotundata]
MSNGQGAILNSMAIWFCETCGGGHGASQSPIVSSAVAPMEQLERASTKRPQGSLPSNTEADPRKQLKAISLCSGKTIKAQGPIVMIERATVREVPSSSQESIEEEEEAVKEEPKESSLARPTVQEYKTQVPYPSKLKADKEDVKFNKFIIIFKQLHINIPIVEALSQMSKYTKFLKDLLTNKRKLEEVDTVALNRNCSSIMDKKMSIKLRDPGSFVIPCLLGDGGEENALTDSGASTNLASRSVRRPRGIVEDVLVTIEKLVFPVDFVILDIDEDAKTLLILGRPFLNTSKPLINWRDGKIILNVGDDEVMYQLPSSMKHSLDQDDECYFTHEPDLSMYDFVKDVFIVNPTREYVKQQLGEGQIQLAKPRH